MYITATGDLISYGYFNCNSSFFISPQSCGIVGASRTFMQIMKHANFLKKVRSRVRLQKDFRQVGMTTIRTEFAVNELD